MHTEAQCRPDYKRGNNANTNAPAANTADTPAPQAMTTNVEAKKVSVNEAMSTMVHYTKEEIY
jgi:hypothetical protein